LTCWLGNRSSSYMSRLDSDELLSKMRCWDQFAMPVNRIIPVACRIVSRKKQPSNRIRTLIFDIDDTLYTVESGFTVFRNGDFIHQYMVDHMGFSDVATAKSFRDIWFRKYHSTLKGFIKAGEAQMLPPLPDGSARSFDAAALAAHYPSACDAVEGIKCLQKCIDPKLGKALAELRANGMQLVIFTNAVRKYGMRVLQTLGLLRYFKPAEIFGVDDIEPHCKPEAAAFQEVLRRVGAKAETSVMFEDSMKNIRACKALGMRTVLLVGNDPAGAEAKEAYASKGGDAPNISDPAVDVVLSTCGTMAEVMPYLWDKTWM